MTVIVVARLACCYCVHLVGFPYSPIAYSDAFDDLAYTDGRRKLRPVVAHSLVLLFITTHCCSKLL